MVEYACPCGQVFTGESDRDLLVEAVDHAGEEHGMADARAQAAVQVLDGLGFPASRAA